MNDVIGVHFLRHGEVFNPGKVIYGCLPNFSLSDHGQEMAKNVVNILEDKNIGCIFCSPMERAIETITPYAKAKNLEINIDDRLIEAGNKFEGINFRFWKIVFSAKVRYLINPYKPSWGEHYKIIQKRMLSVLYDAIEFNKTYKKEVVCVSHQLPIWIVRLSVLNMKLKHNIKKRECELASLTSLYFNNNKLVLKYTTIDGKSKVVQDNICYQLN